MCHKNAYDISLILQYILHNATTKYTVCLYQKRYSISLRSIEDTRFVENQRCFAWIQKWEDQTKDATTLPLKENTKMFLSEKTKFDVYSMVIGFKMYCDTLLQMYPGATVYAS